MNWIGDYYPPYLPTPNPPDENVENYFLRNSSLPMEDIMNNINNTDLNLDSYIDWSGDPGHFVSEFMGYHGVWYHDINQLGDNQCITAGHVHVGGNINVETAKLATEETIRTLINYVDQFGIDAHSRLFDIYFWQDDGDLRKSVDLETEKKINFSGELMSKIIKKYFLLVQLIILQ